MKVLFVAMPFSNHTSRWIGQITDLNWELHFFSSYPYAKRHEKLQGVIDHEYLHTVNTHNIKSIYPFEINTSFKWLNSLIGKMYRFLGLEMNRVKTLSKVINQIKPDIVHTLESQAAGYQLSEVCDSSHKDFIWIHSTWGIDLHHFGKYGYHRFKLERLLNKVDILITEGHRDYKLALNYGFKRNHFIIPSVGGGFKFNPNEKDNTDQPSRRKLVLLKGTHDEIRRGLNALKALEQCEEQLIGFEIIVHNCAAVVKRAIDDIVNKGKLKITIINEISHQEMLELTKRSRLSITVNLSDGVPNTLLEAMLFGAFPIQSKTSMANEWLIDGKTGFIVDPNNIDEITNSIKNALINDKLVDEGFVINSEKIKSKLDYEVIKAGVVDIYQNAVRGT